MTRIIIILFFFICSCSTNKIALKNITLIYSEVSDSSLLTKTFNSSYVVLSGDTMIKVKYPYGLYFDSVVNREIKLIGTDTIFKDVYIPNPPQTLLPYKFTRKGKLIFIEYFENGRFRSEPYYSLEAKTKLNIYDRENICSRSIIANAGMSQFTGRDTIIKIFNQPYACWIFIEMYANKKHGFQNEKNMVYLEKKNLIPIMEISRVYIDDEFIQPTPVFTFYKVVSFIDNGRPGFYRIFNCKE